MTRSEYLIISNTGIDRGTIYDDEALAIAVARNNKRRRPQQEFEVKRTDCDPVTGEWSKPAVVFTTEE